MTNTDLMIAAGIALTLPILLGVSELLLWLQR
jgi:hypothetical protein